jgi:signal transduction histidine kinase
MNHSLTTGTDFLAGGGEMAALIRTFDWAQTPLGAIPGQMHQLFLNLISNALKFVDGQSPVVSIETASTTDKSSTLYPLTSQQPHVAIRVRDNGIGFEMQYVEKIFGMFQRLHRRGQYEGTGIGLAICRRIVENHHGYISADSRPGQGAMFEIVLPLSQKLMADRD